jgi:hypothetical protein
VPTSPEHALPAISRAIAQFAHAFVLGAMRAAEHVATLFQPMADDADAAMAQAGASAWIAHSKLSKV